MVRLSSATHAFNQNQRLNRLGFTPAAGGLQVRTPARREVCPPGHYLLFIINANGVPSVGKVVEIA
ncbi:MAG: DUF1929 domain-containing protein [Acidobacteria bacterium]|nr:DUF1929 domain-containing protein [Acidobacteriota bacterium]MCA1649212.1 DUF1929 domain-containing protein [Acidobacteriota bacterium]